MSCPECLRALQRAIHTRYSNRCPQCDIRRLAYLTPEARERKLDAIQHLTSYAARARIAEEVRVETARIVALQQNERATHGNRHGRTARHR